MRECRETDRPAVLDVVRAAFTGPEQDGTYEVDVVAQTWGRHAGIDGLDLVALADGAVVGHVLGARGDLAGEPAVGIAPLSVRPAWQRRGVGTALMRTLLERAGKQRWPFVLLLGSPDYYRRFGFEPAVTYGISYPPAGPDNPAFQVRRLGVDRPPGGEFRYCWELAERA